MTLNEVVGAYAALGEWKMSSLEVGDVVKLMKVRKAMRPHAEGFDTFMKDVREKAGDWESLPEERREELNKAVADELRKEVEVETQKLSEESVAALVKENALQMKQLDFLTFLC